MNIHDVAEDDVDGVSNDEENVVAEESTLERLDVYGAVNKKKWQ